MKKIILISLVFLMIVPALLQSKVVYLTEDEYKKLKKKERLHYWETLENELANNQKRKAEAIANSEAYSLRIEELQRELAAANGEYDVVHQQILDQLGVSRDEFAMIQGKIDYFNNEIDNWNNLTDKELWKAKKSVKEMVAEYNEYRQTNYAKVPDFLGDFSDLDNRIANLQSSLDAAKPKYYEDTYTVVNGDWLSKISGYSFIYDDVSKWPIIFRANRDIIKDPNLIYPNQIIKIPRGLPNDWKVYKGECLWRIASYPEVYGSGVKWPTIYRANKDKIEDPDLIYPNQIFEIPRD
jgi:nucleoid-associated protein YgaU